MRQQEEEGKPKIERRDRVTVNRVRANSERDRRFGTQCGPKIYANLPLIIECRFLVEKINLVDCFSLFDRFD